MENRIIAHKLKDYARQLEREHASLYRVKAYRRAAEAVERLAIPLAGLVEQGGAAALRNLPGIGDHLSFAIERLITTGDYHTLAGETSSKDQSEDVRALPGVGPHLAQKLWEEAQVRTVAQLEIALRENRLPGLGHRRREHLLDAIAQCRNARACAELRTDEPTVFELLNIDREYRDLAAADRLPTIAPERFNPFGVSWLPLHCVRKGGWKYRAMFSNTALAHRLGRIGDWVVIYFSNNDHRGQRTVLTETRNDMRGRRVVRGREAECRRYYEQG
jgi:putative hydrolase